MKSLNRKVVILTVFILANVSFAGNYSGGSGTETDPYQIGTVSDWNDLMNTPTDWDANFVMTADINLQGVPLIPVGNDINGTYLYFRGIFDGNGHIIRNATIAGYWHIGLFGLIDSNSQIRNLDVEDVIMSGERDIAGLVGASKGTISNCYATGKICDSLDRSANPGGLVGLNHGTIAASHAACDVNGIWAGGLVGRNFGTITDSYADGTVNGYNCLGGLVGWNFGTITDSYAAGIVNGDRNVGGLVGSNAMVDIDYVGTIARCYAAGSVSGNRSVGGLVGINGSSPEGGWFGWCSVTDCYATGSVTGTDNVGGLVGYNYFGNATNCYAAGIVSGNSNVGGLIGSSVHPLDINCFWDVETSGQTISDGGTGLTTAEMRTLATFTSAGWDFVDTWGIGENQTYPFLRTYSGADLDYDGLVNLIDFAVLANHWLEGI